MVIPEDGEGLSENKMETTIVDWGNIGIMENIMETTMVDWGDVGILLTVWPLTLNPKA